MLPVYYLQRSRIAEALHAYTALKDNFAGGPGKCAVTHRMVDAECNVQCAMDSCSVRTMYHLAWLVVWLVTLSLWHPMHNR